MPPTAEEFYAKDRQSWREWLSRNHATERSVWLVFDKGPGRKLSYEDIVEEALCFGWIDSLPRKKSETQSMLYVARRKPKSVWSEANKERVERLTAAALMADSGLAAVAVAMENDSWNALAKSDALILPEALQQALDEDDAARAGFESMTRSQKKMILERIYAARTEPTRMKRIAEAVRLAWDSENKKNT